MRYGHPQGPTFARRFGDNLARHRRAADLSQEVLGEMATMHRTAVGQLERGERVARSDTLFKLAVALEIDPGALFEGITWVPPQIDTGRFEFPATSSRTP
jgi:transcriptional regulator with XRE-family HTH domain